MRLKGATSGTGGRGGRGGRASTALTALTALSALSCARIEPPPGGPPDTKPPVVISVFPDTMAEKPGFDGEAVFTFNETVSEGGQASEGYGTGDLERLILLSPTEKVPVVRWRRNRITVRPREGWRDGITYRVELLPGISDIRNNRSDAGKTTTFTTGGPRPDFTLRGKVFDWTTSQPARGAMLEAVLAPDSLVYRSTTDSSGRFTFGPLPRGEYLVFAVVDQNRDRKRGPREVFDSARVTNDSGKVPELWMFQRDTTPPRLQPPTVTDSVTVNLPFSQKLDPFQKVDTSMITVRLLPDSSEVAVVSLLFPAAHDSLYRAATQAGRDTARADTTHADTARADTTRADTARMQGPDTLGRPPINRATTPVLSRPPLVDRLTARLARPLTPGASYTVLVHGIRNVSGVVTDSSRAGFKVPERPKLTPADSLRLLLRDIEAAHARSDTLRVDSLRQQLPDSLKALPLDSLLKSKPQGGARPDANRGAMPRPPRDSATAPRPSLRP